MSVATPTPLVRPVTVLAGAAGILLVSLVCLKSLTAPSIRPTSPAAPPIDQRLIVRAHTARVWGLLTGGLRLSGTLYPTLPGLNTVRLAVDGPRSSSLRGGHVGLIAMMLGMGMAPAKATLVPCASGYCGTLTLPMFGRYQAQAVLITPARRIAGKLSIVLPLSFG